MRLLIWGAGAIGGTIGAWLARAGHDITLVDQNEAHIRAIQANGLQITGTVEEFRVTIPASTPPELTGTYAHILLCVKAHHTEAALDAVVPFLAPDGFIASFQNGLNELTIARRIGQERTIGAFINFGADYIEPGVIHRGNRAAVVVGELDGSITPRLQALHSCLLDFDDRAIITRNIMGFLWGKLAYGAQLFATALTNESIADCLARAEDRPVYIQLAREVLKIAKAYDIKPEGFNGFNPLAFMPDAAFDIAIKSLDEMVTFNRGSAKTHSGIWRDLAVHHRRTEIDAQIGMIVSLAAEKGIAVPFLSRLVDLIHDIENGKRDQSQATFDAMKPG